MAHIYQGEKCATLTPFKGGSKVCYRPNYGFIENWLDILRKGNKITKEIKFIKGDWNNETQYFTRDARYIQFPCGQCRECKLKHAQQWAHRIMLETKEYEYNYFITLTYKDEKLNYREITSTETGEILKINSLEKRDLQLFWKRLRKITGLKHKYFACGEYGPRTNRPHYHAVVMNLKINDLKTYKNNKWKDTLWTSRWLEKIWGLGKVIIGKVDQESASYVAQYTLKKSKPNALDKKLDDYQKEYITMSKGIAKKYFTRNKRKIIKENGILVKNKKGIRKITPFRYWMKLLEQQEGRNKNWYKIKTINKQTLELQRKNLKYYLEQNKLSLAQWANMKNYRHKELTNNLDDRNEI